LEPLEQLDEHAQHFATKADAAGTIDTYARRLDRFAQWCKARGAKPLPCTPQTLARYLTDRARNGGRHGQGVKPATLAVELAAIAWSHTQAGIAVEALPHRHPHVWKIWRGIRRDKGQPPRRVAPLVLEDLLPVVRSLPDTLIGCRDRALLLLGFTAALRRSELVALEVRDVTFARSSLKVLVRRSKRDQEGRGAVIAVHYGRNPETCPAAALREWLRTADIGDGRLFRSLARGKLGQALGDRAVARIVQRRVAAAGFDASHYAGHSLRAGLATTAARAGKEDRRIMEQGRWSGRAMLDRYVRDARIDDEHNATAGLGY
jgi:site-specific recombinase XerD